MSFTLKWNFKFKGFLSCLCDLIHGADQKVRLPVRVYDPATTNFYEGVTKMNLTNTQRVDLSVNPQNRLGGPASVDLTAEGSGWTGSNDEAFTVGPDPNDPDNKLKCRVTANPESEGDSDDVGVVHFEADGDLGDGVKTLIAEVAINITPAGAEILSVNEGTPEEQ